MVIKKQLKEYIYGVVSEMIPIKEFEEWLYTQTELVDDLEDEFNLALFSFDYNQGGASYVFSSMIRLYIDEVDLELWVSKTYLVKIIEAKSDSEMLKYLWYFNDNLTCEPFDELGFQAYDFESYMSCDLKASRKKVVIMAKEILLRIEQEELIVSGFEITKFPYTKRFKLVNNEMVAEEIGVVSEVCSPTELVISKKWWRFWE